MDVCVCVCLCERERERERLVFALDCQLRFTPLNCHRFEWKIKQWKEMLDYQFCKMKRQEKNITFTHTHTQTYIHVCLSLPLKQT